MGASLLEGGTFSTLQAKSRSMIDGAAQPSTAADALQRPLVPRSRFRARLSASVRVCRDQPARSEGVHVSDSEGLATHAGPESCASLGNEVRAAVTGEGAGRVWSPERANLGADALLTRGRPQRARHDGQAYTHLAGSKTPGRHGHSGCGTREARRLAWPIAARPAWCTARTRP
jgi:hypothetical protein